jgi:hypothetical protein
LQYVGIIFTDTDSAEKCAYYNSATEAVEVATDYLTLAEESAN